MKIPMNAFRQNLSVLYGSTTAQLVRDCWIELIRIELVHKQISVTLISTFLSTYIEVVVVVDLVE